MKFNLFRKPKQQTEPEKPVAPPQEESKEEITSVAKEPQVAVSPQMPKQEAAETVSKTYLKAMPLKELADIENVKNEVRNGNIIILRVTPLANKSIEEVKAAVNQLNEFSESVGGDIARLGEERVVICPKNIRIWREKTRSSNEPVSSQAFPTAA